jgi:hypothetical protein
MTKVLAAVLAAAKTFPINSPRVGNGRVVHQQLTDIIRETGDFDRPASCDAVNEVQNVAIHTGSPDGGTFTLTFTLFSGETFTTAAIAFDANAATIQGAIDTAATAAAIAGWTNADIVVTGGPLTTTPIVVTYSGASVAGLNHGQMTIDGALLTTGGDPGPAGAGAATTSTDGQSIRAAWAALMTLGIITTAPPTQGVDVSSVTGVSSFPHNLDAETVKALIEEVIVADRLGNSTRTVFYAALGL